MTIVSISPDRLMSRLMRLAQIGALPKGGVDRQALTQGEIAAWRLVLEWAREEGLEAACDDAGSLFLTLPGADRALAPILAGSHIDTQPTGGKYDGAAGVMAALEAVVTLKRAGVKPRRDLTVVAWMNEEGSRFAPGMMGSEAFSGVRSLADIRAVTDAEGVSVAAALDALHAAFPDVPRRPLGFPVAAYLELHIEQGPVLEAREKVVGIVTGIQGKKTWEGVIQGAPGHAGTLAMAERRDALAAFARMAHRLYPEVGGHDDQVMFTIGRLVMEPNAPSVVPSRVTFRVDLRHPDGAALDLLGSRFEAICAEEAAPCGLTLTRLVDAPPNGFDAGLMAMITAAAERHAIPAMPILSAAGHDARHLAKVCHSAMIFIPCRDGVSHAEHEFAEPAHIAAGTQVLADVLGALVSQEIAP